MNENEASFDEAHDHDDEKRLTRVKRDYWKYKTKKLKIKERNRRKKKMKKAFWYVLDHLLI